MTILADILTTIFDRRTVRVATQIYDARTLEEMTEALTESFTPEL